MTSSYTSHYSVLLSECLEAFSLSETKLKFADLTFGGGGHTFAIADKFPEAKVFATDQDRDAFENGLNRIQSENKENQIQLLRMNFEDFGNWVDENNEGNFDGIMADLGVSSHHFDSFERGFSFREDAYLDMRMDQDSDNLTASELMQELSEEELANIIYKYGEERYSRRIASEIKNFIKENGEITRTKELENIVFHVYPKRERFKKIHPATKTFQALRIVVNRELEVLEDSIEKLFSILAPGGVLAFISFHSLEDRIIKHKFKEIFQSNKNTAKIITKKPIYPSEKELEENNRSRSAKLRVLQKIS